MKYKDIAIADGALLPASYRDDDRDGMIRLRAPNIHDLSFLERELDLQRLTSIFRWLWIAGRPTPARPLYYQLMLSREILVTENMDMHLVWTPGRIFLKPVPRFLLDPSFWRDHLSCPQSRPCANGPGCRTRQGLRQRALGFLSSYVGLVGHESDFFIAKERHLIPQEVDWLDWRSLICEILSIENLAHEVDPRFHYGELRLGRLNKIYILQGRSVTRGYMPTWQHYGGYLQDNLAWLATATIYIVVVLTALQVGLATSLGENHVFQSVSYGFTIFSISGPLIAVVLIFLVLIFLFINNWVEAASFKTRRSNALSIQL